MALRARNASPLLLATLNPQSTYQGPRPGPTLAPWCSGGLPACPGAESTRKDPRLEEKEMPMCKKNALIHIIVISIYYPAPYEYSCVNFVIHPNKSTRIKKCSSPSYKPTRYALMSFRSSSEKLNEYDGHALSTPRVSLLLRSIDACRSAHVTRGGSAKDYIPGLRHHILHRCAGELPSVRKWLRVQLLLSRRRRQGRAYNQIVISASTADILYCPLFKLYCTVFIVQILTRRCLPVQWFYSVSRPSVFCDQLYIVQERGVRFVVCSEPVNSSTYTLRPLPLLLVYLPLHAANIFVYLPRAGHEQHRRH